MPNCCAMRDAGIVAVSTMETIRHVQRSRQIWTLRSLDLPMIRGHFRYFLLRVWPVNVANASPHASGGFPGCPPARIILLRCARRSKSSILPAARLHIGITYRQKLLSNKSASPRSKACSSPAKSSAYHFKFDRLDVTYDSPCFQDETGRSAAAMIANRSYLLGHGTVTAIATVSLPHDLRSSWDRCEFDKAPFVHSRFETAVGPRSRFNGAHNRNPLSSCRTFPHRPGPRFSRQVA